MSAFDPKRTLTVLSLSNLLADFLLCRFDRVSCVFPGLCSTEGEAEEVDLLISPVGCFGGQPGRKASSTAIHDNLYGLIRDRHERLFCESRLGRVPEPDTSEINSTRYMLSPSVIRVARVYENSAIIVQGFRCVDIDLRHAVHLIPGNACAEARMSGDSVLPCQGGNLG